MSKRNDDYKKDKEYREYQEWKKKNKQPVSGCALLALVLIVIVLGVIGVIVNKCSGSENTQHIQQSLQIQSTYYRSSRCLYLKNSTIWLD